MADTDDARLDRIETKLDKLTYSDEASSEPV